MIDFATLTLVDYGVALVLIVSAILAMLRGMTRELLGLAGWIASILVANYTAPRLEIAINDALNLGGFGRALGWGIPFAATVVISFIIASLTAPGLTRVGLGSFDRWLGTLFGVIRGVLLVLLLFIAAVLAVEGENQLPDNIKSAHTMPLMSRGAYHLARFFPTEYQDMIINNVAYRPPFGSGPVTETIKDSIDAGKNAVVNSMKLLKDEENR